MSLERAKKYLEEKGYADHIIELEESSATVQLAAEALGVEPGMIAKTMSFLVDGEPVLILTEGTAKVDNREFPSNADHRTGAPDPRMPMPFRVMHRREDRLDGC